MVRQHLGHYRATGPVTPDDLLARAQGLLLDFDGPVTDLMPPPLNGDAAAAARVALGQFPIPSELAASTDHLAVLRFTERHLPDRLADVEAACVTAEVTAARQSLPSPEIENWWSLTETRRLPVAIVSNNAESAVRVFLDRFGWSDHVATYACREPDGVHLMKPSPHLVLGAAQHLGLDARQCVFIGDAVSDVVAGHRAGTPVLGLGKNPTRAQALTDAGADAVLTRG